MNRYSKIIFVIITIIIAGCQTGKKVQVYLREDVNTQASSIVVFPMLLINEDSSISPANTEFSNPVVDTFFGKKWNESLKGKNTYVIPKIAFDKIPKASSAVDTLIGNLDVISAIEQTTKLTKFFEAISSQFGDGALAFALVFEDEGRYKSTKIVRLNMGLFDTKNLTWKWITKHGYKSVPIGPPVPYAVVTQNLIAESFEALYEQNIMSGGEQEGVTSSSMVSSEEFRSFFSDTTVWLKDKSPSGTISNLKVYYGNLKLNKGLVILEKNGSLYKGQWWVGSKDATICTQYAHLHNGSFSCFKLFKKSGSANYEYTTDDSGSKVVFKKIKKGIHL